MAYCTRADIEGRLRPDVLLLLTDHEGEGQIRYEIVDRACQEASDEIDSYIGARYALPIANPPGRLTSVAVDIAVYRLYLGRGWTQDQAEGQAVPSAYNNALKFLRDVSTGLASLGLPSPQQSPADAGSFEAAPRIFSREKMKRW